MGTGLARLATGVHPPRIGFDGGGAPPRRIAPRVAGSRARALTGTLGVPLALHAAETLGAEPTDAPCPSTLG
jgi:hypothetical protein